MPTSVRFPLLPGFSVGLSPSFLWCGFAESAAIFNCPTICSGEYDDWADSGRGRITLIIFINAIKCYPQRMTSSRGLLDLIWTQSKHRQLLYSWLTGQKSAEQQTKKLPNSVLFANACGRIKGILAEKSLMYSTFATKLYTCKNYSQIQTIGSLGFKFLHNIARGNLYMAY